MEPNEMTQREAEGDVEPSLILTDDDAEFRGMRCSYLEGQNMQIGSSSIGDESSRHFSAREADLVLLDLRLDKEDGLDLLRGLRSRSDFPIITMAGHRRDEIDRFVGLELGADDYVSKPFGLREIQARIRAVLRRHEFGLDASDDHASGGYRFAGWELDLRAHRLAGIGGDPVPLTKGEYALLVAFLAAPGRPFPREHLLQATRVHEDVFDRSIDVQVLTLRRKLELEPSVSRTIQTERGIGYRFTIPVKHYSS